MKKIFLFSLSFFLLLNVLCGCNKSTEKSSSDATPDECATATPNATSDEYASATSNLKSDEYAPATTTSHCTWSLDGTVLTFSGNGEMDSIDVRYNEEPKWGKDITKVVIQNGVTSIGSYAFSGCSRLTSITLPNSVTSIGSNAFSGCSSLTDIPIPDSVTSIGEQAFTECSSLTSIEIPANAKNVFGFLFSGCSNLASIKVDERNSFYDSRDNCNAIIHTERNALIAGCKNTEIPDNVSTIDGYAFSECNGLTNITIPGSVTSIGVSAFDNCNDLTSVTISEGVTCISMSAFADCNNLTSVTIPDSVTSIEPNAFGKSSKTFTIHGSKGSEAQRYANKFGFTFVATD